MDSVHIVVKRVELSLLIESANADICPITSFRSYCFSVPFDDEYIILTRGVTQSLRQGGRRLPISQDLEAGGVTCSFVWMDLSLKYSQKRNFFHFFGQKKNKIFNSRRLSRAPPPPPIYAPDSH